MSLADKGIEIINSIFTFLQDPSEEKIVQVYISTKYHVYSVIHPFARPFENQLNAFIERNHLSPYDQALFLLAFFWAVVFCFQRILGILGFFFKKRELGLKARIFGLVVKYVPFARKEFENQKQKLEVSVDKSIDKLAFAKQLVLPLEGTKPAVLQKRLTEWIERDNEISYTGKVSGCRYDFDREYEHQVSEFAKEFLFHNPMHFDLFPAARQMEAEVIKMTCGMFGQAEGFGLLTSGGTESILMAVLGHRNYALKYKGITNPNIVMPVTAHPAFIKACKFYSIKCIRVPVNEVSVVCPKQLSKHIDSNTIMIIGSVPNFPHGTIDPIPDLAAIAKAKNIGLHVDCCLGGFVVAFAKDHGLELPKFDFTLDGVTSISCDQHKYGLAPKGVSVCMFKTNQLRQCCYTQVSDWPGGMYATATSCGSKGGAAVSGAWYAMMVNGRKGYVEKSKSICSTVSAIANAIRTSPELSELEVIGDPKTAVVAFKFKKGVEKNIYFLQEAMEKKDWHLSSVQLPPGIHISVTHGIASSFNQLIKDLKISLKELTESPEKFKSSISASVYGASVQIPDVRVLDQILDVVLDCSLKA